MGAKVYRVELKLQCLSKNCNAATSFVFVLFRVAFPEVFCIVMLARIVPSYVASVLHLTDPITRPADPSWQSSVFDTFTAFIPLAMWTNHEEIESKTRPPISNSLW